eukprot:720379-Rhodomonas_salina.4
MGSMTHGVEADGEHFLRAKASLLQSPGSAMPYVRTADRNPGGTADRNPVSILQIDTRFQYCRQITCLSTVPISVLGIALRTDASSQYRAQRSARLRPEVKRTRKKFMSRSAFDTCAPWRPLSRIWYQHTQAQYQTTHRKRVASYPRPVLDSA